MAWAWPFKGSPAKGDGPSPYLPGSEEDHFYEASQGRQNVAQSQDSRGGERIQSQNSQGSQSFSQAGASQTTTTLPSAPTGSMNGLRQVGSVYIEPPDPLQSRPLRFIYATGDGRFTVDREAILALRAIKGPLGVVAVCGKARQGKSFILNQLLGQSSGFQVSSTHKPCTKGLWIWSSPIRCTAPDGSTYNMILLDSEGIDATDQTGSYGTQIFSLAMLLSSVFVFNQFGGIDEAAIDKLHMITEMTKHIRVKATAEPGDAAGTRGSQAGSQAQTPMRTPGGRSQPVPATPGSAVRGSQRGSQPSTSGAAGSQPEAIEDLGMFSPSFIWLLRDFFYDLTDEGRPITPKEYLEGSLKPLPGNTAGHQSRNEIREAIKQLFPDRDCFLFVRPVAEEKDLQNLSQIPLNRMRPAFVRSLQQLVQAVFERGRPKRVGEIVMTGPMLAGLAQAYVAAINAGAVPTILNSWKNVQEQECHRAYEQALHSYKNFMGQALNAANEDELRKVHRGAVVEAERIYNSEAAGAASSSNRKAWDERLHAEMEKAFEEFASQMNTESKLQCAAAIQTMDASLSALVRQRQAPTAAALHQALEGLVLDYEATPLGPAKWGALAAFLRTRAAPMLVDAAEKAAAAAGAQATAIEHQRELLQQRVEDATAERGRLREEVAELKRRGSSEAQALAGARAALERKEKEVAELRASVEGATRGSQQVQLEVEARRRECQRLNDQCEQLRQSVRTLQEAKDGLLQRASKAEAEREQWRQRLGEAQRKAEEDTGALSKALKEAEAALEARRLDHQQQITTLTGAKAADVQRLQVELEVSKDNEARLRKRLEEEVAHVRSAEKAAAELREGGSRHLDALKKAQADVHAAVQDARSARDERNTLERALHQANERVHQAGAAKQAAELAVRRESELRQQALGRAEAAERELARAAEDTREAQLAAQGAAVRAEAAEGRVRELETQLQGSQLAMEDSTGEAKAQLGRLQDQLLAAQAEQEGLREAVTRKELLVQRLEAERQALAGARAQLEAELGQAQGKLQRAEEELGAREAELAQARQQLRGKGPAAEGAGAPEEYLGAKRARPSDDVDMEEGEGVSAGLGAGASGAGAQGTPMRSGGGFDSADLDFGLDSPYTIPPAQAATGAAQHTPEPEAETASEDGGRAGPGPASAARGRGRGRGRGAGSARKAAPAASSESSGADLLMAQAMGMTKQQLTRELTEAECLHLVLALKNPKKDALAELFVEHVLKPKQGL